MHKTSAQGSSKAGQIGETVKVGELRNAQEAGKQRKQGSRGNSGIKQGVMEEGAAAGTLNMDGYSRMADTSSSLTWCLPSKLAEV